jgi:hypothetical protein
MCFYDILVVSTNKSSRKNSTKIRLNSFTNCHAKSENLVLLQGHEIP